MSSGAGRHPISDSIARGPGLAANVLAAADQPRASYRHYPPETTLFRQGARCERVYAIRSGRVKLVRHLPNGGARIVGLLAPGAVLGVLPNAAHASVNPHSALTIGPVDAECWPTRQLMRLRHEQPEKYIELLEGLDDQQRQADVWIAEFSTGRIKSRVARLLLFLEDMEQHVQPGTVELLTCRDMGDILGVTPESVSRVIAGMKRKGLLVAANNDQHDRFYSDHRRLRQLARCRLRRRPAPRAAVKNHGAPPPQTSGRRRRTRSGSAPLHPAPKRCSACSP